MLVLEARALHHTQLHSTRSICFMMHLENNRTAHWWLECRHSLGAEGKARPCAQIDQAAGGVDALMAHPRVPAEVRPAGVSDLGYAGI